MLRSLFCRIFSVLSLTIAPALADPTPSATPQWVAGYYVAYQRALLPPAKIGWGGLTHIVMGRLKANADGTIATDFDWDTTNGPALAKQIASLAHKNGKKAILMLGGDDNSPTIAAAVANNRAAFEANLLNLVNAYGYDGLDLDWENTIDWNNFVLFAQELRLQAPSLILTVPVGALNLNYETVDPHLVTIANSVDRLNLMSYAPSTAWAGSGWLSWFNSPLDGEKPATPVSIASSLAAYAKAGVPKAKLGMGTSFYAICYTGGITGPNQSTETGVALAGGDGAYTLASLYGVNGDFSQAYRHWFAAASEPYLLLPKPNSYGCRYVSYEDEQSLEAKGAYSRANGYGGIIIWTINQGYVASHSQPNFLMTALDKGFLNPSLTPTVGISILQGATTSKPGAKTQFSALVTGSSNTAVAWSVTKPQCGSISAKGLYTAPNIQTTCGVEAKSAADPTKTATAKVTVTNVAWNPTFTVSRAGTWWVEVTAKDTAVASMTITWPDATQSPLALEYVQTGTNYPVFDANYEFPDAGGTYVFTARSKDNRVAQVKLVVPVCNHGADGVCH
jgi:chitinase